MPVKKAYTPKRPNFASLGGTQATPAPSTGPVLVPVILPTLIGAFSNAFSNAFDK